MRPDAVPDANGVVVCFGECLWDVFGTTARPGGAPLNVAVHVCRRGLPVLPLSAVGCDIAGDQMRARIESERIAVHGIARHPTLPTGSVDVRSNAEGEPVFEIRTPAAWDEISLTVRSRTDVERAGALVFGSLAQRSEHNRHCLDELFTLVPPSAVRVFDVNLRPPYVDVARIHELMRRVDIIKVNRTELSILIGDDDDDVQASVRKLSRELSDRPSICVTMGADGAAILHDGSWIAVAAEPVDVVDTVGSGDAFLAGLLSGVLSGTPLAETLKSASHLAGSVAAMRGAW